MTTHFQTVQINSPTLDSAFAQTERVLLLSLIREEYVDRAPHRAFVREPKTDDNSPVSS